MEFELKKKTYKVKVYGEEVEITPPTIDQHDAYLDELDADMGKRKPIAVMKKYLLGTGFPERLLSGMDKDDFLSLISYLSNPKKK